MSDQFIGEIRVFGGNYAPEGWALCDGTLLPIAQNDALYAVIGTTYGGDGQTTFALPDLRGRIPVHQGPSYPLGQVAGTEQVTLALGQLPAHTHVAQASTANGDNADPTNRIWAQAPAKTYTTAAPDTTMHASSLSPAGGSMPHENMLPFLSVNFIIAVTGLFPSHT